MESKKLNLKAGDKVDYINVKSKKWMANYEICEVLRHDFYVVRMIGHYTTHETKGYRLRPAKAKFARNQGEARTLPELLAVAKERGYSPGWARRVHNARQQRA